MTDEGVCPTYLTLRTTNDSTLEHVVGLLSMEDADVETIAVADPCEPGSHPVVVDLGNITKKQWEALEIATELGHYDRKRGGNLSEIADELGISESAVSQRLRAAEAKLVTALLGTDPLHCNLI